MESNKTVAQLKSNEDIFNLIKRRRFQILVHSYVYYKLNDNIVSNLIFDKWVDELISLQKNYPEISRKVELHGVFSNFSSIGDAVRLPLHDDLRLDHRARHLLRLCKAEDGRYGR